MRSELTPVRDHQPVEQAWRSVEQRANGSFFQGWTWIGTWLELIEVPVELFRAWQDEQLVAVALLARSKRRVLGITTPVACINETGRSEFDRITTEYNGVLVADGVDRAAVYRQLVSHVDGELVIGGIAAADYAACQHSGWRHRLTNYHDSPLCRFAPIREAGQTFTESISSNSRYQLRRAMRRYQSEHGVLALTRAEDSTTAGDYFDAMRALHDAYWHAKGERGAFSNAFTIRFHRTLIERSLYSNEVDLLRVAAGEHAFAYLYNFRYREQAYSYQSGFLYSDDAKLKPGVVAHALAAQYYLDEQLDSYRFMAGASQYKKSFSNDCESLYWTAMRNNSLPLAMENSLREIKAAAHHWRNRKVPADDALAGSPG